jgi:phage-related baseplate assembly protein
MTMFDLEDITFADTDATAIESHIITTYEAISRTTLAPGDPVRLFLEALAVVVAQQRFLIDHTGKMNLIRYAAGGFLDHLGAFTETERLAATSAETTVRFSIDEALGFEVDIPAGSRVTPDGSVYFETALDAAIAAGETYVDVTARCRTAGASGNGYLAGQINRMVDPVAYVSGVSNIDTSLGGADEEADDAYRSRIRRGPKKFATAGPNDAYIYWAKTASQNILDVAVYSPTPGLVKVLPLMLGGELPDAEVLADVETILSSRTVRPLTDRVDVESPVAAAYDVEVTYYISDEDTARVASIQTAVVNAVAGYVLWQKSAMGRDINPDELVYRMRAAGAKRVVVTTPEFTTLDDYEVAQDGTVTVTYGGLEAR